MPSEAIKIQHSLLTCAFLGREIVLNLIISSAALFLHINSLIGMIGVRCEAWGCLQQLVKHFTF